MSNSSQLHSYIARLQQRLRLGAWLRGAAIFTGTALAVTVVLVLVLNHFAFPARGIAFARIALLLGAWLPRPRSACPATDSPYARARRAPGGSSRHPELEQRLTTFEERDAGNERSTIHSLSCWPPIRSRAHAGCEPSSLVPDSVCLRSAARAWPASRVLVWMVAAGPGYLGYGASLLWTGPKKNAAPLYALAVTPGNITVRRNSDQLMRAHVTGMQPDEGAALRAFPERSGMGTCDHAAAAGCGRRGGLSFRLCRPARKCGILRRRRPAGLAALQGARGRSAFREGHSRHLSLSASGPE